MSAEKKTARPLLSIMISTRNRPTQLLHCLRSIEIQTFKNYEVIVLDDGGETYNETKKVVNSVFPEAILIRNASCQGISASRNTMMNAASGEWYFTIDDDALFPNKNCLNKLQSRLESLSDKCGILAVKIIDFFAPNKKRLLVPFPKFKLAREPHLVGCAGPVSYYLGGAQAIRRSLIDRVGGYDASFVYGQEEQDLSYRTLEAGYEIVYAPEIEVYHMPAKSVLTGKRPEMYYSIRSRFVIAMKYLPLWAIPTYLFAWIFKYSLSAVRSRDFRGFIVGVIHGTRMLLTTPRQPVSAKTVQYLNKYYGRLWY